MKGHQIIGELRLNSPFRSSRKSELKGHQIIGELRLVVTVVVVDAVIERSPDHW